jgi:hypothetical protein
MNISRDLLHALLSPTPPTHSRVVLEEAILLALAAGDHNAAHVLLLALEYLKPRQRWQVAAQLEAQHMGLSPQEAVQLAVGEARRYLGGRSYRRFASPRFRKRLSEYLDSLLLEEAQRLRTYRSLCKLTTAEIYLAERVLTRCQKRWKNPLTAYQAFDTFLLALLEAHYRADILVGDRRSG